MFKRIYSSVLIVDGRKIHYAGPGGKEAEEAKLSLLKSLDEKGIPYRLISEKGRGRLIFPPFGNTHCHIAMSLFRSSPGAYNLQSWLKEWIFPKEEKLDYSFVKTGSELGMLELIRSGCGAAADMYYFPEAAAEAAGEAGIRLFLSVDGKSRNTEGLFVQDEEAVEAFAEKYRRDEMIRPSFHVHSLYLYQPELYPQLGALASRFELPLQIHVAETRQEVLDLKQRFGNTAVPILREMNLLQKGSVLAHCVYLSDEDISILQAYDVALAHNPASNCKLGSGICDTKRLADAGLNLCLGTDGAGSNDGLNLFEDLRLACYLPNATAKSSQAASPEEWLYRATVGGYRAMGFGAAAMLRKGSPADFVIYNPNVLSSAPFIPESDPVSLLVYAASPAGVESMMINGKYVLKDGEVLGLDREKVVFEALKAAEKLLV